MKISHKLKRSVILVSFASVFILSFQNCSEVSFSDANTSNGILPPVLPVEPVVVATHCGVASIQSCAKGFGTEDIPYQITNASCFLSIAESPSCHYKVMNDLDFASLTVLPIDKFSGVLDGQGFSINNLVINAAQPNAGLFSILSVVNGRSPVIKNLKISKAFIENSVRSDLRNSGENTGILAAYISGDTVIDNLSISGEISAKSVAAGTVAAVVRGNAKVSHVDVDVIINGSTRVGGIIGQLSENAKLSHASVKGEIKANNRSGGAIGIISDNVEVLDVISEVKMLSDAHKDSDFIGVQFNGNTKIIDSYTTVSSSILGCLSGGESKIDVSEKQVRFDKQTVNVNGCNGTVEKPSYTIFAE